MKKKKAKLHSLFGVHPPFDQPDQDVVGLLTNILERAKAGEISGVTLAWVDGGQSIHSAYAAGSADKNLMMAAVHGLHTDITRIWYSEFQDIKNQPYS